MQPDRHLPQPLPVPDDELEIELSDGILKCQQRLVKLWVDRIEMLNRYN